ncbi:flagellar basal body rod protein FlgB [Aliarcobacter cibarius]|jgi:flagellar basal-body rod protein FlgB|uniref:Flagellar basal body rod protein FlgB n=1 Tax=Aliarcobacter cibarius TaxID=255507 RepID=A0A5J6REN1_9BACT|nr:flagellar basal body rod protein FlgB [Aliarcobacter cibarius]QEZ88540.1 flagellar proximal rod protein FlgB [Aliarcobacter cibarius]QKJ26579.1 flagellar proximal rod protein FlgB [Aliarcobacter cibarius]TLS98934.1 flagellar basal body rod protein FlgB [Aliarcobacter cibarius]TLS99850.1 flagellar basal body rod protein FlgB [Aliarcobacter cibarius]TLT03757.1 flagellar basal body rod protein FlgB [Aliarcobacter cibarius]
MNASKISGTLFEQLNFRAERQKVISSNIANVNTPDYKTKELVFDDELNLAMKNSLQMNQTNRMHMNNIDINSRLSNPRLVEVKGLQEQNDGNNVNLDSQISEQSKNKVILDAIQTAIKRDSRLFRNMIDSSSKI